MKKKYFTLLSLILCLMITCMSFLSDANANDDLILKKDASQSNPAPATSNKRFFVGADIGASFGDYSVFRLSPLVGYNFSPEASAGVKFVYIHSWEQVNQNTVNATTLQSNTLGGNVFFQYNPVPSFYLKTEFEYDNYKNFSTTQSTETETGVPFLFLGAGYSSKISKVSTFNAGLKVDVLNNENSPFPDFTPFFSVGVTIGI